MADQGTNVHNKNDFISREAAISEIMSEPTDAHYPSWYAEKLKQVFAADVRPVVHGAWKPNPRNPYWLDCTVCGYGRPERIVYDFCPGCGADMREPNLDTTKGDNHD